ncbi:unnamed protein product [Plutella xylostella]|uniref:(diamondback moth) hypothetical protein n=1 Tax=Plutella xylostella TaxID=51655 RepID=A0A8S4EUK2_PLUXY|nr:unnamed protein product [Plutella xylostella]
MEVEKKAEGISLTKTLKHHNGGDMRMCRCIHIRSSWSSAAARCGIEGAGWGPWLQGFAAVAWLQAASPAPATTHEAAKCGIEGAGWGPWLQGFAAVAWLQAASPAVATTHADTSEDSEAPPTPAPRRPAQPADLAHLFSIGHDSLMFEVWMDPTTGILTFRLSRPEASSYKVLSETSVEAIPLQQWCCLGLNVKELVHKRKIHIQVTVFVNGCEIETVSLPLQGILVRKIMPTMVLIGQYGGGAPWYLSDVSVYRAPCLCRGGALRRAALGPLAPTSLDAPVTSSPAGALRVEKQFPNYALVTTPELLDRNVDWDQVFDMTPSKAKELEDNILLTFSASSPATMNLYHQTVALPTVFAGRVGSTASLLASSAAGIAVSSGPSSSIPEALNVTWTGAPLPSQHRGVPPAVYMLGGVDVLLFMFARVVELDSTDEEQATALSILLQLCLVDQQLYCSLYCDEKLAMLNTVLASNRCKFTHHMLKKLAMLNTVLASNRCKLTHHMLKQLYCSLYCDEKLAMLNTVLASNRCKFTHHMLKSFLDAACNVPILTISGSRIVVRSRTDVCVREPCAIILCVRAAKDMDQEEYRWEEDGRLARGSLWALLLSCVCALLDEGAPHRQHNRARLERAELMRHLLLACKERFLNSGLGPLDRECSAALLRALRHLPSSPPQPPHLALLTDVLLLLHQWRHLPSSPPQPPHLALLTDWRHLPSLPPQPPHLALLTDASDTFVTHSRANFYFLLTSETQDTSENTFLNFMSRRKSSRRGKRKSGSTSNTSRTRSTNSSINSEDILLNENNVNVLREMAQNREAHDNESIKEDQISVDSTKQLKGFINLQIKERRKHNISSTSVSENSDVTPEDCMGAVAGATSQEADGVTSQGPEGVTSHGPESVTSQQPEGVTSPADGSTTADLMTSQAVDGALSDYVVIDVDDVTHTTVEMYTSGIFEQRRVRAGAEGGWAVCEGILNLLHDAITVMPESDLNVAAAGPLKPERLVVLGHHRNGGVRAALVRVLGALQRRAPRRPPPLLNVHLADQIALYPGTWDLATACAGLLTKCDVPLEDQLDDDIWLDLGEEAACSAAPLLAVLPRCLDDVPLAHNITLLIRRLIDKVSLKALSEVAVVEVVVRSITAVGSMPDQDFEGRELLLEDLYELLNKIALKALATQHNMQIVTEIHHMLTYIEASACSPDPEDPEVETPSSQQAGQWAAARAAQCRLCVAQITYLDNELSASGSARQTNYFTSVLSSAVSLATDGVPRTELQARRRAAVTKAVSLLVSRPTHLDLTSAERALFELTFNMLLTAISESVSARGKWWGGGLGAAEWTPDLHDLCFWAFGGANESVSARGKWWGGGSGAAEWTPDLHDLCFWAFGGAKATRPLEPYVLRTLYQANEQTQLVATPTDPAAQRKLAVYLLRVLQRIHLSNSALPASLLPLAITDWARGWALATQAALPDRLLAGLADNVVREEAVRLSRADRQRWTKAARPNRDSVAKVVFRHEALATKTTESAMLITRSVVDEQNAERKAFMEHLRRAQARTVAAAEAWQRLLADYTHELALWHDPASYPRSWALDSTEGAGRVRVRLRRAHCALPPRFLQPDMRHKADTLRQWAPLQRVVGAMRALQRGLVARLQLHETVTLMARVRYVRASRDQPGELLLSDREQFMNCYVVGAMRALQRGLVARLQLHETVTLMARVRYVTSIHFVPEDSEDELEVDEEGPKKREKYISDAPEQLSWTLEQVRGVATRRWCLREVAVEIFLYTGHAHLIAFDDPADRAAFLRALPSTRWCLREVQVEIFLYTGHAHLIAFDDPADRAAFLRALPSTRWCLREVQVEIFLYTGLAHLIAFDDPADRAAFLRALPSTRWCLREVQVEIFLYTGLAHLIAFDDPADRAAFLRALPRSEPDNLQESMNLWRQGLITNWEYLMRLNGLAGRSYNDLMQYPIFPFVIADYTSRILDLNDPKSFRDFSKPMAVQNKKREQHYINTYNDLSVARREGCSSALSRRPHHYASLYSNSGAVLHYLVRVPPFTELFLNYQGLVCICSTGHHYASLYSNSGAVLHYLVRVPPFTELFLNYQGLYLQHGAPLRLALLQLGRRAALPGARAALHRALPQLPGSVSAARGTTTPRSTPTRAPCCPTWCACRPSPSSSSTARVCICSTGHHYASLYSNSGAVLHYLVRVPPFTELFLNYQGLYLQHGAPLRLALLQLGRRAALPGARAALHRALPQLPGSVSAARGTTTPRSTPTRAPCCTTWCACRPSPSSSSTTRVCICSTGHHYASLYSNSGAVLHYLVRVPPFTELFLNYQGLYLQHGAPLRLALLQLGRRAALPGARTALHRALPQLPGSVSAARGTTTPRSTPTRAPCCTTWCACRPSPSSSSTTRVCICSTGHHYASLYSNSGAVLHYLVRVPPFTELFLNYQGLYLQHGAPLRLALLQLGRRAALPGARAALHRALPQLPGSVSAARGTTTPRSTPTRAPCCTTWCACRPSPSSSSTTRVCICSTGHHYASLYSNSGAVLHYLVRVPPFTELFLNYQGLYLQHGAPLRLALLQLGRRAALPGARAALHRALPQLPGSVSAARGTTTPRSTPTRAPCCTTWCACRPSPSSSSTTRVCICSTGHHYASLYSNSGAVLHYLVRVPPFTELFLNYQDNNFDMPDRTFHSLQTTWRLITQDSPTDVKELIPELFFLPELFKNTEGLNLGVRQCGAAVDDVELPPWAAGDPRLFTLIHRQALESPIVTEQLPHWIDLVFGYKQTGQAAIDAINVFPACNSYQYFFHKLTSALSQTYYGFDPSVLEDSLERTAAEAMVRTYGQAPRQLLRAPHARPQPDLHPAPPAEEVWSGVSGARWGAYVGAPPSPPPRATRRSLPDARSLQPLPAPRAAAAAPRHACLLTSKGRSLPDARSLQPLPDARSLQPLPAPRLGTRVLLLHLGSSLPDARSLQPLPAPRAAAAAPRHACLVATPESSSTCGSKVVRVARCPTRAACSRCPRRAPPPPRLGTRTNSTSNQQSGLGCMSAALLSWGHADRTLRLKRRDARPEPVLTVPPHRHPAGGALSWGHADRTEPVLTVPPHRHITSVATCLSGACPVLVGDSSGRLMALLDLGTVATRAQLLHAHTDAIVDINVCVRGGLVATASVDGLVVLWDLNKLTYIRTLPNRDMVPVTHVTISDTLCDVATVHDLTAPRAAVSTEKTDKSDVDDSDSYEKDNCNFSSLIRVHTCNATFVGSVKVVEKVTAVCYSNAPEGVSVNSIAAGLSTGGVRLYSSWDLRPVSYIPPVTAGLALISICYSCDGDVLFGITEGGGGVAWDAGRGRTPLRLLPAHALL